MIEFTDFEMMQIITGLRTQVQSFDNIITQLGGMNDNTNMLMEMGRADAQSALEKMEALRNATSRKNGTVHLQGWLVEPPLTNEQQTAGLNALITAEQAADAEAAKVKAAGLAMFSATLADTIGL